MRRFTPWLTIVAIFVLAGGLRLVRIDDFQNEYYTATVSSMLIGPSNFLFGSFDPGGVVTVDKPPAAFWIQALSATLFGVHKWSVNLPQAVMGSLTVLVLYFALAPSFGRFAATVAAACLAIVPAAVLVDSRNEPDTLVMFTLTLAALCLVRAVRSLQILWLLAAATLIGIAFNAKMLVAFVPLPAFLAYYMLAVRLPFRRVIARATLFFATTLAIASIWTVAVALTPVEDRPYIGSTRDNSIITLVLKYNGLDRFARFGGIGARMPPPPPAVSSAAGTTAKADQGIAGLLRNPLAGQLGWLLPLALINLLIGLAPLLQGHTERRLPHLLARIRGSPHLADLLLWGGWLVIAALVFGSARATTTHAYYLVALGVPMAAVIGIGLSRLWFAYCAGHVISVGLPLVIAAAALYQVFLGSQYISPWRILLTMVVVTIAIFLTLLTIWRGWTGRLPAAVVLAALTALTVIPATYATSLGGQIAGPTGVQQNANQVPAEDPNRRLQNVIDHIDRRGDAGAVFTIATINAREAARFIIAGAPALAIGGFSGNDPIYTTTSFRALATGGDVRYFLAPDPGGPNQRRLLTGPSNDAQLGIIGYVIRDWEDVSTAAHLPPRTLFRFPDTGS